MPLYAVYAVAKLFSICIRGCPFRGSLLYKMV
jgi:hypothetical protein